MSNLKKLTFAPLFLISFAYLCYQINSFISSPETIFSLDLKTLLLPTLLAAIALLSSFFFIVFATLAQDWIIVGITILVAGILPVIFLPTPLSLFLAVGSVVSLGLIYAILLNKLKTYLNFQPSVLLSPSIRNLSTLFALIIALLYFLSLNTIISQKGFEVPDSLINSVTQLSATPNLDQLDNLTPLNRDLVKKAAKTQIEGLVKPYTFFIAPVLGILTFFAISSSVSVLSFLDPVFLYLTFLILREIKFIKFTTEMREVKKLMV